MRKRITLLIIVTTMFLIINCGLISAFAEDAEKNDSSVVTSEQVENIKANGNTYNSIIITWDKVDGAIGYKIKRYNACDIQEEDSLDQVFYWEYENGLNGQMKGISRPVITIMDVEGGDATSFIDDSIGDLYYYSHYVFYYKVAPVFEVHSAPTSGR